jgi:hypothetical protein
MILQTTLSLALILLTGATTMTAADSISFLGRTYKLASHNHKASAMWEFTTGAENVNNWSTLLTVLDRPEAKTRPELDQLAQGILDTYKQKGGKVLMARTMSANGVPFNYIIVAFPQPALKRFELNFVKLALAPNNAIITVYGVRIDDPTNDAAKAKAFLSANSEPIGKALEQLALPSTASLPRREF